MSDRPSTRRPHHPLTVLGVALVLPGMGQVLNDQAKRGLVFVFYILLLGVLTRLVAPEDATAVGRVAGGVFVYALSVLDAYQQAVQRRRRAAVAPEPAAEHALDRSA